MGQMLPIQSSTRSIEEKRPIDARCRSPVDMRLPVCLIRVMFSCRKNIAIYLMRIHRMPVPLYRDCAHRASIWYKSTPEYQMEYPMECLI